MAAAFAPVLAGAVLLAVAGIGKLRRPAPTVGALGSVGFSVRRRTVRALGLAEVLVGLVTIVPGGAAASALLGLSYLAFTGFVIIALRSGGALSSCGCLGRPDTPPTRTHAVLTASLGVTGLVAAGFGGVDLRRFAWTQNDVVLLLLAGLVVLLAWLAFTVLPHARLPRTAAR